MRGFTDIIMLKNRQRTVADQLQHVATSGVDSRNHNIGIIVQKRNYLISGII
jgi:hypothetical protein